MAYCLICGSLLVLYIRGPGGAAARARGGAAAGEDLFGPKMGAGPCRLYRCLYMFHVSTCLMSRPAAHLSGSPASSQCGPVLPSQVEAEGAVGLVG